MRRATTIALSLLLTGCGLGPAPGPKYAPPVLGFDEHTPVEWEHGWKTKHVIATRYANRLMGYNIGFRYPLNPDNCDRAELSDFMEKQGGFIYESGGHRGAEMLVVFKDVKDKESAKKKLKSILPNLSKLIASL